jgi:hypothetical protein
MNNKFEKLRWNARYITLLAVTLSVISAIFLIFLGSEEIVQAIIFHNPLFDSSISSNNYHLFKFYL